MSTSPMSSTGHTPPENYLIFIPSHLSPSSSPPSASSPTPVDHSSYAVTFLHEHALEKNDRGLTLTGRKGHKKSRGACFTCKRQKIKCKENRPSCDYCAHRGIKCEWPTLASKPRAKKAAAAPAKLPPCQPSRPVSVNAVPVIKSEQVVVRPQQQDFDALEPILTMPPRSIQLHDTPPVFSMEDMRLFNHFIQRAYPHHPSGNDSVWTHEIPSLASSYDYLIHSMLALSASELSLTNTDPRSCPQRLRNASLFHRSKSITALNSAIQRGVNSVEEGNAMLAAIFSLLFQSTFISDGLVEYMTFIRGGIVVGGQMLKQHLNIVFRNMNVAPTPPEDGMEESELDGVINDAPTLGKDVVLGAVRSLKLCSELCSTKLERRVFNRLMIIAKSLVISSSHAYVKLREMYGLFAVQMTPTDFRTFTSPTSPSVQVFKILQAHFVALQLVMNPVAAKEAMPRATCPVKEIGRAATVGWLVSLHRDVEGGLLRRYCVWTRWVEEEVLGGRLLDGSSARRTCPFEGVNRSPVAEGRVGVGSGYQRVVNEGVGLCPRDVHEEVPVGAA